MIEYKELEKMINRKIGLINMYKLDLLRNLEDKVIDIDFYKEEFHISNTTIFELLSLLKSINDKIKEGEENGNE